MRGGATASSILLVCGLLGSCTSEVLDDAADSAVDAAAADNGPVPDAGPAPDAAEPMDSEEPQDPGPADPGPGSPDSEPPPDDGGPPPDEGSPPDIGPPPPEVPPGPPVENPDPPMAGPCPDDTDCDGVSDADELLFGTDPEDVDSDNDHDSDGSEWGHEGEDPDDADGDGIIDALENANADNDMDGVPDPIDPAVGWQLTYGRFIPFAVVSDGTTETRLEVRIGGGGDVSAVVAHKSGAVGDPFVAHPIDDLFLDGEPIGTDGIPLFDDGTHGDRFAGDGVWTRGGITAVLEAPALSYGTTDGRMIDAIVVTDSTGDAALQIWDGVIGGHPVFKSGAITLGIVSMLAVDTPVTVGPNIQTTPHAWNVVDGEIMLYTKRVLAGTDTASGLAASLFGAGLPDDFDFIYPMPESDAHVAISGRTLAARNATEGIGRPIFDDTEKYGSDGQLQALSAINFQIAFPTLHEAGHLWAVHLDPELGLGQSHWTAVGTFGMLGGFDPASLVDLGNGNYQTAPFRPGGRAFDEGLFGPIELYLMGLVDAASVPDIPVLANVAFTGVTPAGDYLFKGALEVVTIDDVIAVHGPRDPPVATSQKDFAAAFVAVSQQPLTAAEMAWLDAQAELFGADEGDGIFSSFPEATLGLATMNTQTAP